MTDSNNTNISLDTHKITIVKSPRAKRLATKSPRLGYTSDKNKTVPLAGLNLIANPKKQRDSDTESVKHDEAPTFDLSGDADENENVDENFEDDEADPIQGQALSGTDDYEEDVLEEDEDEEKVPLTYEEILEAKQDFLYKLDRLEKQGYRVSRKYTLASNLDDIRCEYNKLKRQRDVEKSIKFYRKALMGLVSGAEYLNNKFDPLDLKLDGWSESQMENISDYDEVFEELHDKYSESISMAPELKLMFMVGGSAFMFHLTKYFIQKTSTWSR